MSASPNNPLVHSVAIKAAINGQESSPEMARRRYQNGSLELVGKREKKWQLRWREDVILPDGKLTRPMRSRIIATHKEARTQREARRIADRVLANVNDHHYKPRVLVRFREFTADWDKTVLSLKKASYAAKERSRINHHLLPAFGDSILGDLTARDIQCFIAAVKVGPKTKRNIISTLRSMYRSAKAWGLVSEDWFDGLVLPEWIKPESRYFTVEEFQRMVAAAPEPLKTWLWLLGATGARLGEVCALTPADFNLEQRVVIIRRSAWRSVHVGSTKSKRPRVVRIGERLAAHMQEFVKGKEPDKFLFQRTDGSAWYGDKVVSKKLKPLLKKLGISAAGAHAFRHMNASLMDQLRVPDRVRMDRLGHVDFDAITLGVYSHASSQDHDLVAAQLDDMLAPQPIAGRVM